MFQAARSAFMSTCDPARPWPIGLIGREDGLETSGVLGFLAGEPAACGVGKVTTARLRGVGRRLVTAWAWVTLVLRGAPGGELRVLRLDAEP